MAEHFKPELESILPNWTKGAPKHVKAFFKIGRASCRERV